MEQGDQEAHRVREENYAEYKREVQARLEAEAENDRLRQVLRHIAGMDCYTREDEEPVHLLMMRMAGQALTEKNGEAQCRS